MLALCLYALGALGAQTVFELSPETSTILDYADTGVCALFLLDFALSLLRAPDRWAYVRTWGWIDLLSSIPALDIGRWGRIARLVRVFRVLRGLRAARTVAAFVVRKRAEDTFLAASLVALLLVVVTSIAILQFELEAGGNIRTAEDAVWWAATTITTVGYGDRFPITSEGRFVAALLMAAGVGLFGTFSGFLAAWFLDPGKQDSETQISLLRMEIAELRKAIESLRGSSSG
jgi:voltage-gated potassium channel